MSPLGWVGESPPLSCPVPAYGRGGGLDWILLLLVVNLADTLVGVGVLVYAGYRLRAQWRK
jgi:hypothetical protein